MLFRSLQARTADTDDGREPVRPDQALEGYTCKLHPGGFRKPFGAGRNAVIRPRIFHVDADLVGFAMRNLQACRIAQVPGAEYFRIEGGFLGGDFGLRHVNTVARRLANQTERVRRAEREPPE